MTTTPAPTPGVSSPAAPTAPKRWRSGYAATETLQRFRPEYSHAFLNNPHKGTTTFQRFNGDPLYPTTMWDDRIGPLEFKPYRGESLKNGRYPDTRISYCRWLWSVLEPQKGKLRYDIIEGALKAAAERGQSLQVRTQPYIGDSLPAWYWASGARADPNARGPEREPDHNDPLYLKHWGEHVLALGQYFDGHPNLECFDVAYGGACGEMGGNATPDTAAKLVDVYRQAFKKTQLISMVGTPGCAYGATLTNPPLGWRGDCFGDLRSKGNNVVPDHLNWNHMFDEYPTMMWENGVQDAWKTAPVIFETCWTVAHFYEQNWDIDWIIEQGYKYHPSVLMPKSVWFPEKWNDKILEFNRRIGYRFYLMQLILPLEARPGQTIEAKVTIDNKGVGPIYKPYKFALRFTQGKNHHVVKLDYDIRRWLPDLTHFRERITFPQGLEKGETTVSCAIVNEAGQPVVKLAIDPPAVEGWHYLGHMDVV